jgi:hypothetical protein
MTEVGEFFWDDKAWIKYPQYHKWFNKLYVAEHFGYICGPAGVAVPKPSNYVVRPIYNLLGMGVNAAVLYLSPKDTYFIQPGYFWVEYFSGTHYSVDYIKENGKFKQLVNFIGINRPENLSRFLSWTQTDQQFTLPKELEELDVDHLNIEAIDDNIIEVHLRPGFNRMIQYQELIPVFEFQKANKPGYTFIREFDDADGWLSSRRLGYLVR